MAYIYPAPGVSGVQATLKVSISSNVSDTGFTLPGLQDITMNNANDVFEWTQLDATNKFTIATTSTNSLEMNIVVDQDAFFGKSSATAGTAEKDGLWKLSTDKTKIKFEIYLGDTSSGGTGKTLSGTGYFTEVAPTVSADEPVWVSPITISMDSAYTVT
jgi:hypothetical protein